MASYYDDTVPYFTGALTSLSNVLTKANAEGNFATLLEARLISDMLPLAFQVYLTCEVTAKFAARFCGTEPVKLGTWTDLKTFEDCMSMIDKAKAELNAIDKTKFDSRTEEPVEFALGPKTGKLSARNYAMSFSMPNLFFHLVTAYNILRKEGIPIGKMDYLPPWGVTKAEIVE